MDAPFIFNETTADFQTVTVQGHLTYRVADPMRLAALLDYSVRPDGGHKSDDLDKLPMRVSHAAQNAMRAEIQGRPLRAALVEADAIAQRVRTVLMESPALTALGVELLGFSILAIKPVPETSKALEAEARERLLREADDAIYSRRNNAVEQERTIRENELNTEVAVQTKQREIEETRLAGQIALEEAAAEAGRGRSREQQDAGRRPGLRRGGDAEAADGAGPEVAASAGVRLGRSATAGGDGLPGDRGQRDQGRQPQHLAGPAGDADAAGRQEMSGMPL